MEGTLALWVHFQPVAESLGKELSLESAVQTQRIVSQELLIGAEVTGHHTVSSAKEFWAVHKRSKDGVTGRALRGQTLSYKLSRL